MNTERKVRDIIARMFDVKPDQIGYDSPLASTDLDSLSIAELLFTLEDEFNVEIANEVGPKTTLRQLIGILDRHSVQPDVAEAVK